MFVKNVKDTLGTGCCQQIFEYDYIILTYKKKHSIVKISILFTVW